MEQHRLLDRELNALRDRLLLLGGEAEVALQRVTRAFVGRDSREAGSIIEHDDEIDRLEVEIDRMCVDIIALRQPAARDLRFVISVAKITQILERIADHACNIARAVLDLNEEPELGTRVDLPRMAEQASRMLRASLDAFTTNDAAAAREIIESDDEVDEWYDRIFHDLIEMMVENPTTTRRAARLLLVAKHVERISDYVTDICELTVYAAQAQFIKHSY